jgi:2-C-methyl-D-erythritol 2,4-cyclodiphosphate synthase
LHAICDACLGAAALGDIGRHFPDSDPRYKNIDSRELLRQVEALLDERGWRVENVDSTVIAQAPKLMPYFPAMIANIAADLGLDADCVNVKATTTEKLGFAGREEGIARARGGVACVQRRKTQRLRRRSLSDGRDGNVSV